MGAVSVFMVGNYLNQPSEFLSALHDVVASCVVLRVSFMLTLSCVYKVFLFDVTFPKGFDMTSIVAIVTRECFVRSNLP